MELFVVFVAFTVWLWFYTRRAVEKMEYDEENAALRKELMSYINSYAGMAPDYANAFLDQYWSDIKYFHKTKSEPILKSAFFELAKNHGKEFDAYEFDLVAAAYKGLSQSKEVALFGKAEVAAVCIVWLADDYFGDDGRVILGKVHALVNRFDYLLDPIGCGVGYPPYSTSSSS